MKESLSCFSLTKFLLDRGFVVMKSTLLSLFFSFCVAFLPSALHAESKTFTEADAAAPIFVNKGDTLTFLLKSSSSGSWMFWPINIAFADSAILANDPSAALLSKDAEAAMQNYTGTVRSDVFTAANSGQITFALLQTGPDRSFPLQKIVTFIVNIQ